MRSELKAHEYSYRIHWSSDNGGYVATVAEFPTIHAPAAATPRSALDALTRVVIKKLDELESHGQPRPISFALS